MINDYEIQNLINTMQGYMASIHDMHKTLLYNQILNNCTEDEKKQFREAYSAGLVKKLASGDVFYNTDLLKSILDSELIKEVLHNKKEEIKNIIFGKMVNIFSDLEKNDVNGKFNSNKFDYTLLISSFKNEINNYIKISIQDILKGESKSIFDTSMKNITKALAKTSISNYAENLFKKAQIMINEEIIKDVIE